MMSLHLDKKEFKKVISLISDETGIRRDIIEKDYYVTMILKELFNKEPNLVFKGGTSLSKCFHAIDRFSEDIDINYIDHQTLNRTRKKKIKETLKEVVALCKLSIVNLEETRSNRIFNQYKIEYPKSFEFTSCVVDKVIVETGFQSPSFPCVKMMAQSMIGEFIMERGSNELMKKYDLEPFEVTVQSLERTFIDKLFATAEYYLRKKLRDIQDIFMIYICYIRI